MANLKQGKTNTYTMRQYKNGKHGTHDTIRVTSASGKVFSINKRINNAGEANFWLTDNVFRASKKSAINYLKNH